MSAVLFVLLLAGAPNPPPAPGPPATPCPILAAGAPEPTPITKPNYLRIPAYSEIAPVFPPQVVKSGQEGRAVLRCIAQFDGSLKNCIVVSETPIAMGVAASALVVSTKFRLGPTDRDGAPVACRPVTLPVVFAAN